MPEGRKFLTITEAAQLLGVSRASLRRWSNSGRLRCFRVGGRRERRFLEEDLLAFMQATHTQPAARPTMPPSAAGDHGRHICLFFRNPDEQWQLMYPYLSAHLAAGMPVLYIQDSTPPEQLTARLRAEGLDVGELIARGLLRILPPSQAYLLAGHFDVQRMLAFMESAIRAALAAGHSRVLLTGEMSWSLSGPPGATQMMAYEALLNPLVEKYPAVTIICQYDLKRFNAAGVLDALLTHPLAQLPSGLVPGFYGS